MKRHRLIHTAASYALASVMLCIASMPLRAEDRWILVDTAAHALTVMRGENPLAVYEDISIGRNGPTREKVSQDKRTPLGAYRVIRVRASDRFYRFIALDYPSLDDARDARRAGRIDEAAFRAILSAHERGQEPPANTPLGGNIGIHGIGNGDANVHSHFNWTEGCIALTNEQIDSLTPYITPRMTVVIR